MCLHEIVIMHLLAQSSKCSKNSNMQYRCVQLTFRKCFLNILYHEIVNYSKDMVPHASNFCPLHMNIGVSGDLEFMQMVKQWNHFFF